MQPVEWRCLMSPAAMMAILSENEMYTSVSDIQLHDTEQEFYHSAAEARKSATHSTTDCEGSVSNAFKIFL